MFLFLYILKIQLAFLLIVNSIAFLFFEILPILYGEREKISDNFKDLLLYQFGMSVLSLIFGILIYMTLHYFGLDLGFLNISSTSVYIQVPFVYLFAEFFIYLSHLGAHKLRIPLISKYHKFHHKITNDMDWVNSKKEHPVVIFLFVLVFSIVFYVFFRTDFLTKVLVVNIFIFLQAISHYRYHFSLFYFDKFFLFPKDHFDHHTKRSGPYGVTLSIFDTIFGTRN
jgi:hypothetical protein